jgi:hypothetical protein
LTIIGIAQASNEMRDQYDFQDGVPSKHAAPARGRPNVVRLDDDYAGLFDTPESVGAGLQVIAQLVKA